MLGKIVHLQMSRVQKRIDANHKVRFDYDEAAINQIIARCTEVESGGRMIDAILTNTILPTISQEILRRTLDAKSLSRIALTATEGDFRYDYVD
jgi:type VI secretion system protein VasG